MDYNGIVLLHRCPARKKPDNFVSLKAYNRAGREYVDCSYCGGSWQTFNSNLESYWIKVVDLPR